MRRSPKQVGSRSEAGRKLRTSQCRIGRSEHLTPPWVMHACHSRYRAWMDTFLHGHFVDALFEDKYNSTLRAMQGGGPLQLHLPEQCRQGNEICHIPDKKQIKAQSNQAMQLHNLPTRCHIKQQTTVDYYELTLQQCGHLLERWHRWLLAGADCLVPAR